MKYATPGIAVAYGMTGIACFCRPPRGVTVADSIVFSRFFSLPATALSGLGLVLF